MRLCQFLMQDESFPISHAGWDFLVFSLKMRFSHILIQDETFPISHAGWDFSVFLCYMRLFVRGMKNKKNTLLRPLHYVLAVKKSFLRPRCEIAVKKYGSIIIYANLSNYICSVHYFSFSANICQNGRKMDKFMKWWLTQFQNVFGPKSCWFRNSELIFWPRGAINDC